MRTHRSPLMLLGVLSVVVGSGCQCQREPAPTRSNVLIVSLDTTRYDRIGVFGGIDPSPTPVVDKLARQGARFERAYTVTPLTIPAHSSLFTGRYPPEHGVRDNGDFFLGDSAITLAELFKEQGYATMASVGAEVTSHHWGFAQGFDAFFDDMGERGPEEEANRWKVERRGDLVIDDAMGWLEPRAQDPQPWFAWVHLFDAHHPYEPPPPFDRRYAKSRYQGEIAYADHQVGRLVSWLEQTGKLDNTWIVVLSDHGEGLGSHGEALHGTLLYNATTHIPLVIRPPGGLAEARAVSFPTSLVDVLPTLVGANGLRMPESVDGLDLGPWLGAVAAEPPKDRVVYAESLYAWHHYGWAPQKALVDPTHHLIDSTTPELYAGTDAEELTNLVDAEPDRLLAMEARLEALIAGLDGADPSADRAQLSAERMAQLEALGYMTGVAEALGEPTEGLPDPVQRLHVLREIEVIRQAIQNGQFEQAVAAADAVIEKEPGMQEPRMLKARSLTQLRRVGEAVAVIREVLELQPNNSQAMATLGSLLLQSNQPSQGVPYLEQALAIDPYLSQAWGMYLHGLMMLGDLPRLEREVERAEALVDTPEVHGMKGLIEVVNGDLGGGRALIEQALADQPFQPFLRFGLGVVYRSRGEDAKAEEYLLEEVNGYPPALPARKVLVQIYAGQDRWDDQVTQLQEVIRVSPLDYVDHHALAQALYNLKRFTESAEAVRTCMALAPEYAPCVMLHANVLSKLDKRAEAEAEYHRALQLAGQEPKPGGGGATGTP